MADDRVTVGVVSLVVVCILVLGFVVWLARTSSPPVWDVPVLQFVSGTEYNVGEAGQVIVEARYANGSSALDSCVMSIWYPDKSLFLSENATNGPNGNQYVSFTVPNSTGVYEYQAQCVLLGNVSGVVSKSFHVSEFQNETSSQLRRPKAWVTP